MTTRPRGATDDVVVEDRDSLTSIPHILFGGDYNPEQWPEETWREDAELMQAAGVNLVSLGIFAWARIEPREGRYELAWLDRIIDLLQAKGVSIDLATPTASPPPWLVRRHPEILPVTVDGTRLWHGGRRHYCPHSPAYRERAQRVTRALAEHYRGHPAVVMWHIDNEYACHFGECFCDASAAAFREWLRLRHHTLERLNAAWGTAFWSQTYTDWAEIEPPRQAPTVVNPSQRLDWQRFSSDSWIDCFDEQAAILREITPGIPLTTNFMGFHKAIDYWTLAAHEDVVSNDAYPDTSEPEWMVDAGMVDDAMRSLGGGRPWVLMEQATAHVNWRQRNVTKRPGIMRLGSYQAIARGADGIMFFQWRASRAGAEKFHSAMLPHGGLETRQWREVHELGAELARLDGLAGSRVTGDVAIAFDWTNWWAIELEGKPSVDLRLLPQVRAIYRALFDRHLTVDFVHPAADLSAYRLIVAPSLYLVDEATATNLQAWVRDGGTLVSTFFSGIVDSDDWVHPGAYPGPLADLFGLEVEEFVPYREDQRSRVQTADGQAVDAALWVDVIRLTGAEAMAAHLDDFFAGTPAVTRHRVGTGQGWYVGTMLDRAGLAWLVDRAAASAGVAALTQPPSGIEIVDRSAGDERWRFVLNYAPTAIEVPLNRPGVDLITGSRHDRTVVVGPLDVAIIHSGSPQPIRE